MAVGGSTTTNDLSIYNLGTKGSTDYERVRQYWSGNIFNITNENGGTGISRAINLSSQTSINLSAPLVSLGGGNATGGTNQVSMYNQLTRNNTLQNQLAIYPHINQTVTAGYRGLYMSVYEQAKGSGVSQLFNYGTNTAANGAGTHTDKIVGDSNGNLVIAGKGTLRSTNSS